MAGVRGLDRCASSGVRQVQAAFPDGATRLRSGLKFNKVAGCGTNMRCVVTDVAPRADVDLYSYSAWESVRTGTGAPQRLIADLDAALAAIRTGNPTAGPDNVMVGEFGLAREIPDAGECRAARVFRSVADSARAWGVRYAIFWQVADNAPDPGLYWNYGLVKYDTQRTLVHQELGRLLAGHSPGAPAPSSCPAINQGGVVNGIDYTPRIAAGDPISIFGANFAGTGNVVHIQANARRYRVAVGSRDWYESSQQINVRLPTAISGRIVVYVTQVNGVDSNGQVVSLTP